MNSDNRSFAINFEMTVWMPDPGVITAVEKMLEADFANCRKVTKDEVLKRHPLARFISQAARLFSPIL